MIRPFTLLCFLAFATAGAWLYQVKHAVAMKDRELVEIRRQTEQARQRIDILRAEWALLNEPERLRQTASRVLTLEPMQPQHFARITEFERRLPAAVAFTGAPDIFAAPPPPVGARDPNVLLASAPGVGAARPATAAPPAAAAPPAPVQARTPEAPAPQALAAAVAQQRAEALAQQRAEALAQQRAEALAQQPPARPAAPPARPIQPAVHIAPAPAPAEPVTRMTRSAVPETTVASALGSASALGRPMLPPPVPVSPAAAATLDGLRPTTPAR